MNTPAIMNRFSMTILTGCHQSFTMPIASSKFSPQLKASGLLGSNELDLS